MKTALAALLLLLVMSGAALRASASWPHGDPNVVIRAVLAQPQFHEASVAPSELTPLQRLLRSVQEWIRKVFRRLFEGVGNAGMGWLAVAVAYLVAFLGLLYAAFAGASSLLAWSARRGRAGSRGFARALGSSAPDALREQAAAAAEASDYGRAIACLFRAALFALDFGAIIAFDAARTPGEYRRMVRRMLALGAPSFDELTTRFVRAAFGSRAARREDYDAAMRAYATFAPYVAPA